MLSQREGGPEEERQQPNLEPMSEQHDLLPPRGPSRGEQADAPLAPRHVACIGNVQRVDARPWRCHWRPLHNLSILFSHPLQPPLQFAKPLALFPCMFARCPLPIPSSQWLPLPPALLDLQWDCRVRETRHASCLTTFRLASRVSSGPREPVRTHLHSPSSCWAKL